MAAGERKRKFMKTNGKGKRNKGVRSKSERSKRNKTKRNSERKIKKIREKGREKHDIFSRR